VKRLLALLTVPAIALAIVVVPQPASAQVPGLPEGDSPLQTIIDQLDEGLEALNPVLDAVPLDDITGPLNDALGQLSVVTDQLEGILAQAEPACVALEPVLAGVQPVLDLIQPLLDQLDPETNIDELDALDGLLAPVDALVDEVTGLCAAQAETTTTTAAPAPTTAPAAPAPAPSDALPRTGGDLLIPGLGLLGAAGAVWGARKRLK